MASSTSTIRWAIRSATSFSNPSPSASSIACAAPTPSAGRAATSSSCCSPKWSSRRTRPSRRDECCKAVAEAHSIDQPRSPRHHQHRRERLSRRRPGRRDADQERGHRDVPGEGERASELSVLQAGHERPRRGAAVHRGEPAARPGAAGVRAALPAEGQSQDRGDRRGGGLDPLDPSRRGDRSRPRSSFPSPRTAASSCRSAPGCFAKPARRPAPGSTPACRSTTMAVNVSAMEFRDENFLESLFAVLDTRPASTRDLSSWN